MIDLFTNDNIYFQDIDTSKTYSEIFTKTDDKCSQVGISHVKFI